MRLDSELNRHSRIHPLLRYLPQQTGAPIYIKREDELSAGVVGSKLRKYLSILPYLQRHQYTDAILIGSAHSNNVMGLSQLLIERGINVHVLIKQPGNNKPSGNYLFLKMLTPAEQIHLVPTQNWSQVEHQARQLADQLNSKGRSVFVVPEGGDCREALPGILTLADDLLENERSAEKQFPEIWIDSGTGVSAIGLLLGLRLREKRKRRLHITLIAGSESEFIARYHRFEHWCEELLKRPIPGAKFDLQFHAPATAPSFGSVNKTLLAETGIIAREMGILMDPVYSVKHLYTVKHEMLITPPQQPQLVIYSGGPLGLSGFQHSLAPLFDNHES